MPSLEFLADPETTVFLTEENVEMFHEDILTPGQLPGYRSIEGLRSALGRPKNALDYDIGCDLIRLAAYYWHGISMSHCFVDGNKRTGFISSVTFLLMNGVKFEAPAYDLGPWIETLFEEDRFKLEVLEDVLRRHCHYA